MSLLSRYTLMGCLLLAAVQVLPVHADPIVIAHRGASGYLPEHTLPAKVLAHAQGADYLEQDVVMTADDELVVLHDLTLELISNVAELFPTRAREDGSFYVIDFTLSELRQLRVTERRLVTPTGPEPAFPGRFPPERGHFSIHTLAEEIELIQGLNHSTGRQAGIYPELKAPWFHHQHGKDISRAVLSVLKAYGYDHADAGVFVQSFDAAELQRVHDELLPAMSMELPLIQLIAHNEWLETYQREPDGSWAPLDYTDMHTAEGLAAVSRYAQGIGPAYGMLVEVSPAGEVQKLPLIELAHAQGLQVHPYTFRADDGLVPPYSDSFADAIRFFVQEIGVDGLFTDFPDLALDALRRMNELPRTAVE